MNVADVLFSAEEIAARVMGLAAEIKSTDEDLTREQPLLVVCILRGAFIFTADLMRALHAAGVNAEVDFLGLSSYGTARESQGRVHLTMDLQTDVTARDVLIVDDILDSGRTLRFVLGLLQSRGAARVRSCVLLDKPSRREIEGNADFTGFRAPDAFVVGYGMDVAGLGRGMPYIGTAPDEPEQV